MLQFDEAFFEEEVRNEFTVPSMMKRAWAGEMSILAQVAEVCKKYDIPWYATFGTLLGAVRHQGFVPWDDDIDIILKREDFKKLFEVLPKELPKEYGINSVYTAEEHNQPWGSVTNSKTLTRDEQRTAQFYGCPYVVGVDIYVLDYLPRDKALEETQVLLYSAAYDCAQRFEELEASGELTVYLPKIEELCGTKFDRTRSVKHQLWMLSNQIAELFTEAESDEVALMSDIACYSAEKRFKKEWFDGMVMMPFEQMMIPVPIGYHEILTKMYGDYRVVVRGAAHDYPFYKAQEEYL